MSTPPAVSSEDVPTDAAAHGFGRALRRAYRRTGPYFVRYGTLVAFALVVLAFSLARPSSFATWENWKSIFNLGSVVMIMAGVVTVPMIMNDFDLSIGYNVQLLGAFAIVAVANWSLNVGLGIALTLLLGATIGATIGSIVAYSKVSAFVITLGAGIVMLGAELRLTHNGETIYTGIPQGYLNIANKTFLTLPLPVWITFGIYVVLWFLTEHSVLGRYMAAIGGNIEAARLSGVNVEIVRMIGFVIVGLGAAVAGIIVTAQAQQYFANAAVGYLLPAYAGVFLGAATLRAGQFHVIGTFIGVLFMQTIQTGLIIMNYPAYTADVIQGLVLIAAVLLSRVGGGQA
jgi:ribose transport system permease protein